MPSIIRYPNLLASCFAPYILMPFLPHHSPSRAMRNEKRSNVPVRHPAPPTKTMRPKADHRTGQDHHHSLYSPRLAPRTAIFADSAKVSVSLLGGAERLINQVGVCGSCEKHSRNDLLYENDSLKYLGMDISNWLCDLLKRRREEKA
jgi:hypothetical protein